MLLHATIHWPKQQHLDLWPYAFEHAVFLWNNLPGHTSGVAPLELFTGVTFDSFAHLHRSHVWGCPIYVLDPKLQDGKKLQNGKLELDVANTLAFPQIIPAPSAIS